MRPSTPEEDRRVADIIGEVAMADVANFNQRINELFRDETVAAEIIRNLLVLSYAIDKTSVKDKKEKLEEIRSVICCLGTMIICQRDKESSRAE